MTERQSTEQQNPTDETVEPVQEDVQEGSGPTAEASGDAGTGEYVPQSGESGTETESAGGPGELDSPEIAQPDIPDIFATGSEAPGDLPPAESDDVDIQAQEAAVVEAAEGPAQVETGSENEHQTEPTPDDAPTEPIAVEAAPREELTPIPVNAVVDGRYLVQNQLLTTPDRNLYRISAVRLQRCATCGRLSAADEQSCRFCGEPLSNQPPAEFYLMAESHRPEALMQDPSLMNLHLYHPNLVPVVDFFQYKPVSQDRYYAVAEPRQGVRLSQMQLPRPSGQVLNWAMQLADALDYLHSRGVVGAGAEADDILVQGDRASLASLQNARITDLEEQALADQQSSDLARLAATMFEAYTGQPASMTPEGMLSMPTHAPEPVVSAFKTAIEPMQGMARQISAGQWRDILAVAMEALAELERPGKPVDFVSAGLTDVGKLRDQNQDSFAMSEFVQASVERPVRIGLYVVSDGMGGHKGGEIASAIAAQSFAGEIVSRVIAPLITTPPDRAPLSNEAILQNMTRAVQTANDRIYKARDSRYNDMGTTLVSVVIAGGKAYIVNVGDSRLYLYTQAKKEPNGAPNDATRPLRKGTSPLAGTAPLAPASSSADAPEETTHTDEIAPDYVLKQVSIDHSLVHRLVELGQLDAEEAKTHPHRNFVYRSVGGPPPIEVDTFVRTLRPGDRILLCSDGLNTMLDDDEIANVLGSEPDTQVACRRLIDMANQGGGHDNITCIIVDVTDYLPMAEHPQALANS